MGARAKQERPQETEHSTQPGSQSLSPTVVKTGANGNLSAEWSTLMTVPHQIALTFLLTFFVKKKSKKCLNKERKDLE